MLRNLILLVLLVVVVLVVLVSFDLVQLTPEGEGLLDDAGDSVGGALQETGEAIEGAGDQVSD